MRERKGPGQAGVVAACSTCASWTCGVRRQGLDHQLRRHSGTLAQASRLSPSSQKATLSRLPQDVTFGAPSVG